MSSSMSGDGDIDDINIILLNDGGVDDNNDSNDLNNTGAEACAPGGNSRRRAATMMMTNGESSRGSIEAGFVIVVVKIMPALRDIALLFADGRAR